jgi:hypothetical protein
MDQPLTRRIARIRTNVRTIDKRIEPGQKKDMRLPLIVSIPAPSSHGNPPQGLNGGRCKSWAILPDYLTGHWDQQGPQNDDGPDSLTATATTLKDV